MVHNNPYAYSDITLNFEHGLLQVEDYFKEFEHILELEYEEDLFNPVSEALYDPNHFVNMDSNQLNGLGLPQSENDIIIPHNNPNVYTDGVSTIGLSDIDDVNQMNKLYANDTSVPPLTMHNEFDLPHVVGQIMPNNEALTGSQNIEGHTVLPYSMNNHVSPDAMNQSLMQMQALHNQSQGFHMQNHGVTPNMSVAPVGQVTQALPVSQATPIAEAVSQSMTPNTYNGRSHWALWGLACVALSGGTYLLASNYNMNNMFDVKRMIGASPYAWCEALNKNTEGKVSDICFVPNRAQTMDKTYSTAYNRFFGNRPEVSIETKAVISEAQKTLNDFTALRNVSNQNVNGTNESIAVTRPQFTIPEYQTAANNIYMTIDTNNQLTISQAKQLLDKLNDMSKKEQEILQVQQIAANTIIATLEDGNTVRENGQVFSPNGELLGNVDATTVAHLKANPVNHTSVSNQASNSNPPVVASNINKAKTNNRVTAKSQAPAKQNEVQGNLPIAQNKANVQNLPTQQAGASQYTNQVKQMVGGGSTNTKQSGASVKQPPVNRNVDYIDESHIAYGGQQAANVPLPTQNAYHYVQPTTVAPTVSYGQTSQYVGAPAVTQGVQGNGYDSNSPALERITFGKKGNSGNTAQQTKQFNSGTGASNNKNDNRAKSVVEDDVNNEEVVSKPRSGRYYELRKEKRQEESDEALLAE